MQNINDWINEFLSSTGLNILFALVILFLGLLIIKTVGRISKASLQRTPMEGATASFVVSILNFALKIILVFLVVGILFPNASTGLIAALGTAGLALGLALQGSLSNFANGIIIIFTKPFKEGDYVDLGGIGGSIRSINVMTTELVTPDNKKIVLSNTRVINSDITNYSARPTRRIDLLINIAYGSDVKKAKELLEGIAAGDPKILTAPASIIKITELGGNAVVFDFKVWVSNNQYWDAYYDIIEKIYFKLTENGIELSHSSLYANKQTEMKK